jgi:hypothetical protein
MRTHVALALYILSFALVTGAAPETPLPPCGYWFTATHPCCVHPPRLCPDKDGHWPDAAHLVKRTCVYIKFFFSQAAPLLPFPIRPLGLRRVRTMADDYGPVNRPFFCLYVCTVRGGGAPRNAAGGHTLRRIGTTLLPSAIPLSRPLRPRIPLMRTQLR